jgi:hypothetical protein
MRNRRQRNWRKREKLMESDMHFGVHRCGWNMVLHVAYVPDTVFKFKINLSFNKLRAQAPIPDTPIKL